MLFYKTMKERVIPVLLLTVMTVTGVDGEDLDDNVVAKMMDINISQVLKLTWEQYNNHSWRFRLDGGGGYTHVVYSWSPGEVNVNSV